LSALIVGSFAPDLEYLMKLSPRSEISHTILGLFIFCIPMGLIALWIFHQIWKRPILALISRDHVQLPGQFTFRPLKRLAILSTAVFIGALTHLVWDSFTHQYGWVIEQMPAFSTTIFQTRWGEVRFYNILQHGSTALGLTVLAVIAVRHRKWIKRVSPSAWGLVVLACIISAASGIGFSQFKVGYISDLHAVKRLVGISILTSTVMFIVTVTLLSLMWHVREKASAAGGKTIR